MKLIERTDYLNQLEAVRGTPDIKVITGVRRSGKSKLMEAFMERLKQERPNANIIHINYNLTRYETLREYHELHDYVEMHYAEGKENYVFIDEVQMCASFEKAIIDLHTLEKYDIYITGSNAFLLSSDLATLFTGRCYQIEVYPFSFSEFCTYYADLYPEKEMQSAFDAYLLQGGFSGAYAYNDPVQRSAYLRDVFQTLIIRDIADKYKIRRREIIKQLTDYLMDNVSNIVSARNIAEALNRDKAETNNRTISTYIAYLTNAFVFYRVKRYDMRGKRYLSSGEKLYLCDHALKYAQLGTKNMDYGRALENVVAVELLRRGYEVYAGVLYKKEIDFVAIRQNEKIYIQVAENIDAPETFARETAPLLAINDAYPKMIIARTRHEQYQYEGVQIADAAKWLYAPKNNS